VSGAALFRCSRHWPLAALCWLLLLLPAFAAGEDTAAIAGVATPDAADTLYVNRRPIVTFRATLLGRSPAERAALARAAVDAALADGGRAAVDVWLSTPTARTRRAAVDDASATLLGPDMAAAGLRIDGHIVFYLLEDDLEPLPPTTVAEASEAVRARLQLAVSEVREMGDLHRIGIGAAYTAGATVAAYLLLLGVFRLRRATLNRLGRSLEALELKRHGEELVKAYTPHVQSTLDKLSKVFLWIFSLLLLDVWLTFVLRQFAFTRPWAERSSQWLLDVLTQFLLAAAGAVPGLVTAALIFIIARLVARGHTVLMERAERGNLVLGWLDADTAGPTRRVGNFVIWLFALAMAYPFLPGASSQAFKGVSVLAGLMLSLGASGVVGQIVSGLSLMYSRALRPGEYVRIGETEGTVTAVGMFATKIHTGLGEEVSLPNAFVFGQPVRNFSRLVANGQFVLQTAVTIGYATPWRQVHAMLLEAARRTPGVADDPPPYVIQTALSDFYVEYRLCAQGNRHAPQRRAEAISQLHGNVQDVFNEHGVQIMSPHYMADPPSPQVVPPAEWYTPPARPPGENAASPR
jgi:small-conductance mechanosensitive channel